MFKADSLLCHRLALAGVLRGLALGVVFSLVACQSPGAGLAPAHPGAPWVPQALPDGRPLVLAEPPGLPLPPLVSEPAVVRGVLPATAQAVATPARERASVTRPVAPPFALPELAAAAEGVAGTSLLPAHPLTLPELIDLAQRRNPLTRIAWEQARQAAAAVGMAEALYLPMISAVVVGGVQRAESPLPYAVGNIDTVRTTASGVIPALTVEWLLFDFGERAAAVEAARQLSFGANVQFQAAHQRLIQGVALAYYHYDAARTRTQVTTETLANANTVLQAVQARQAAGLATTVELAQVRQQVAQARLLQVQAQGVERDTYQALIAATGLPPETRITVARLPERHLLPTLHDETEARLRRALAQRPDVLGSYAAAQAAHQGVMAARAAFRPKVFLAGIAAHIRNDLNVNGLSFLGQPISTAGVLLGVALPLYDGGLRDQRLSAAQSRADEAVAVWRQAQESAVLEMVMASNALRSALEAHHAAQAWVEASSTTYNAALEAYEYGVGTLTLATEAVTDLLAARMAEVDAYAGALAAAATLAHATGQLTSANVVATLP